MALAKERRETQEAPQPPQAPWPTHGPWRNAAQSPAAPFRLPSPCSHSWPACCRGRCMGEKYGRNFSLLLRVGQRKASRRGCCARRRSCRWRRRAKNCASPCANRVSPPPAVSERRGTGAPPVQQKRAGGHGVAKAARRSCSCARKAAWSGTGGVSSRATAPQPANTRSAARICARGGNRAKQALGRRQASPCARIFPRRRKLRVRFPLAARPDPDPVVLDVVLNGAPTHDNPP